MLSQLQKVLLDARVEYINAYATLVDAHTVSYTDEKGVTKQTTADKIIISVGGRPKYPSDVEGAQLGITSDDIFWQSKPPGKTLCVGASYISLECAGFMHELGYDVSVMVRSILLRGFDSQSAIQIGEVMERSGVRFIGHAVPVKLERRAGPEGQITVTFRQEAHTDGSGAAIAAATHEEQFDTVMFATGRDALVKEIGLDKVGVVVQEGKIVVDASEATNVPNIFAIGDVILNRPELTPVAIKTGQLLARRLFGKSELLMDYHNVSAKFAMTRQVTLLCCWQGSHCLSLPSVLLSDSHDRVHSDRVRRDRLQRGGCRGQVRQGRDQSVCLPVRSAGRRVGVQGAHPQAPLLALHRQESVGAQLRARHGRQL